VLLVGPGLQDDANSLMTSDRLDDGKTNPYKGTATVVVDARLANSTDWYLLDTTKPVKPFIFQQREKPTMMSLTDITSDHVFNQGEFLFSCEARGAAGYGFWQLAAKGN
jgi:phage major head subunit gpT-like protein